MTEALRNRIGSFGVWRYYTGFEPGEASELEGLGYSTLWLGGSPPADLPEVEALLGETSTLTVGTSIVNIWSAPAEQVAESFHRIDRQFPGRFILGFGAGHPEADSDFRKPYDALIDYADVLIAHGVPKQQLALAALGPRVLKLAADRTAGALPYLITAEHTRQAREILGPDALLVPEHKISFSTDPVQARATARPRAEFYLSLRNYVSNLRRLGFAEEDVAPPGSDRLIDALVLHGTADRIADGLVEHLRVGADQIAIQVTDKDHMGVLRALAPVVTARV
ncbi:LLM class F420-dependent oxidoreductase [Nocardia vermiculata]|uniref:LLM class F420-dependent oxidoreductase n=1 Tax=Nocardia vermiculata TaxID=257274 RepID=A0A846XTK1_9NOCA|nr:LLM class F420-dependent oxidoreductase [Nocardia vermiculata]NKY50416.1 LLM class F420-dependent oxidoreductase [Nocardia vermiculata]